MAAIHESLRLPEEHGKFPPHVFAFNEPYASALNDPKATSTNELPMWPKRVIECRKTGIELWQPANFVDDSEHERFEDSIT